MFEKFKSNILFNKLLGRPNIDDAYKIVPETDSWYDTISKVHNSLAEIQKKDHEIIEIISHDNLKLKAVYYPNNSNVTVICSHGYTSHAEREWAFPGLFYLSLGYNVLIPYHRAHGLSAGKYISFGVLEHLDMINWAKKVNKITPNGKIIFHGLSMGGEVVLDLANKEIENVKCLIADAPSCVEYFFKGIANHVFKTGGDKVAEYANIRFKKEFGFDVKDFETSKIIANCKYPILLSAGSKENKEEFFDMIKEVNPSPTEIIILPGCDHGNGMYKQTEMYQNFIKEFLNKYL